MVQTFRAVPIKLGEFSATPEAEINESVQVMRVGTFHHPEYGEFQVTKEHLASMVRNHAERVRGIDVAIDYAHLSDREAAAWVQELYLNEDETELWARVKWTPKGKQILVDREYRYLSAEFTFEYQNNETLQKFGPTLLGAGLTNRPVIKGMAPVIELNEGKGKMDPKEKIAPPVAPVAPAEGDEKEKKIQELAAQLEEMKKSMEAKDCEMGELKKKLGDYEVASAKASEEKALAEKVAKFDKLMSEGKAVEAQREAFMSGDAVKFAELSQPVKLGEAGSSKSVEPKSDKPAEDQIIELAEKALEKKEVKSLAEGIQKVLLENAELRKQYEKKE